MGFSSKNIRKFVPGVITGVIIIATTAVLLYLSMDPDHHPHARIYSSSEIISVGEPVFFDASNSTDPEGRDLDYMWTINEDFFTYQPSFLFSFPSPGNYTVVLKVTDTGENSDTETVIIEVREI
ncbi:MAG: PKD domain-containing protein [Thermoplasmatota archaeon]